MVCRAYWESVGQAWRREPEINIERQNFLEERLMIKPNIKKRILPFTGIELSRADVEWLLATSCSRNENLDLRGAVLMSVDLSDLPLANVWFSLTYEEWTTATMSQTEAATAKLDGARFDRACLEGALMVATRFQRASLEAAHLEDADLQLANFDRSWLASVHMEHANLQLSRFQSAWLVGAHLEGADLRGASFDKATNLKNLTLGSSTAGHANLTDVHWDGANLGVVDWALLLPLGEEHKSRIRTVEASGDPGDPTERLAELAAALRETRQLTTELRSQGLSDDADRFAFRGHLLRRRLFRYQRRWAHYVGSFLLAALSGYGYRPLRSFAMYFGLIAGFAVAYYLIAPAAGIHMCPLAAIVFSITSFHGRGFSPSPAGDVALTNPLTVLAAGEAILGLIVEIAFIATFTQRFFGK